MKSIQKNINALEKQRTELQTKLEQIEMLIDDREGTYDNRSEKWQESDKGLDHGTETDRLSDLQLDLDLAIDELGEAIDSLTKIEETYVTK